MTKEKVIPQIRFSGFTDTWEQRKLEEVITVGNGMDYKHLSEGDIPVYGTGGYMLSVDKALSYDKDAIGIGRKGTIDKPYVLKAPFWTVDTLFYCIPKEDYSLDFVYCIFQNVNWKEKDESTGVPSLSKVNINSTDVKVPTLAEQEKIGAYFAQLDNLITLHQRKYDKLTKVKKAMLEKMFPENGSPYPEIRFKGFTDAWEQRELGTISDVTKLAGFEFTEHIIYSDEGNVIALRGLNVKNGTLILDDVKYIDGSNFSKLSRSKLYVDDVLFTYVGTVGELAIIPENDRFYLAPNVSRIRFSKDYYAPFMVQQMGSKSFYDKTIFPLIATSSQPALSMENIRKFVVNIPKDIAEQQAIGNYFKSLDRLITLHQRKLEKLKNIKKACLEKMFV